MAHKTVLTEADLAAIRGLISDQISDQVGTGMATLRSQLTKEFTAMSVHAGKWSTELEGKVEQKFRNLHSAMHVSATHGTEWAACQAEALAGWRVMQN